MHELQEGREERKREKKKGATPEVSEKGPKNQTSTPKSVENGCQNRPKSCKNRPKRVPKQPNSSAADLDADPDVGFRALP